MAIGICLLVLAAIFGLSALGGVPARATLLEINGDLVQLTPATQGKFGTPTRFRLAGSDREFQYISKSREMGRVEEELKRAGRSPVRVLVEPDDKFSTVL